MNYNELDLEKILLWIGAVQIKLIKSELRLATYTILIIQVWKTKDAKCFQNI